MTESTVFSEVCVFELLVVGRITFLHPGSLASNDMHDYMILLIVSIQ